MNSAARISAVVKGDACRVAADGEIDLATAPSLQQQVDEILSKGSVRALTVDLSGVSFIDSSGLRAVLSARDAARAAGARFALAAPSPAVARVLDAAGVRDWFDYE